MSALWRSVRRRRDRPVHLALGGDRLPRNARGHFRNRTLKGVKQQPGQVDVGQCGHPDAAGGSTVHLQQPWCPSGILHRLEVEKPGQPERPRDQTGKLLSVRIMVERLRCQPLHAGHGAQKQPLVTGEIDASFRSGQQRHQHHPFGSRKGGQHRPERLFRELEGGQSRHGGPFADHLPEYPEPGPVDTGGGLHAEVPRMAREERAFGAEAKVFAEPAEEPERGDRHPHLRHPVEQVRLFLQKPHRALIRRGQEPDPAGHETVPGPSQLVPAPIRDHEVRALCRGDIEFGLVTAEAAAQAYLGRGVFEGEEPREDLRTLWYYVATPNMFVVRSDAGVESLSDLEGKPLNPGIPGSSTESIALATFETLGIEPEFVRGSTADAIAATRDGQVVGYVKSAAGVTAPDSSFVELSTFVDVEVVSLTEEEVEQVTDAYPYFPPITVPAGVYEGQDEPYHTLAVVPGGVATVDSLSEQDAYEIVKHVFEQKSLQDDAFAGVRGADLADVTLEFSITPLHAGAVRYFREIGVDVPDRLIPGEAR